MVSHVQVPQTKRTEVLYRGKRKLRGGAVITLELLDP